MIDILIAIFAYLFCGMILFGSIVLIYEMLKPLIKEIIKCFKDD